MNGGLQVKKQQLTASTHTHTHTPFRTHPPHAPNPPHARHPSLEMDGSKRGRGRLPLLACCIVGLCLVLAPADAAAAVSELSVNLVNNLATQPARGHDVLLNGRIVLSCTRDYQAYLVTKQAYDTCNITNSANIIYPLPITCRATNGNVTRALVPFDITNSASSEFAHTTFKGFRSGVTYFIVTVTNGTLSNPLNPAQPGLNGLCNTAGAKLMVNVVSECPSSAVCCGGGDCFRAIPGSSEPFTCSMSPYVGKRKEVGGRGGGQGGGGGGGGGMFVCADGCLPRPAELRI